MSKVGSGDSIGEDNQIYFKFKGFSGMDTICIIKASEDLDKIYGYISQELYAERVAKNLLEKIETSIMRLQDFLFSCNYVADEFLRKKGYNALD